MPVAIPIIEATAIVAGVGAEIYSTVEQSNAEKKLEKSQQTPPTAPTQDDAAKQAETQQTNARRALLASGGETSLTGIGGAPLISGQTQSSTLIGS